MSTSSITSVRVQSPTSGPRNADRRPVALAIVLCAQLMIILDMTVVNIALLG